MAKILQRVKMVVSGDGYGPSSAKFKYVVNDSGTKTKGTLVVTAPNFELQDLETFFDGYVSEIEIDEGIS